MDRSEYASGNRHPGAMSRAGLPEATAPEDGQGPGIAAQATMLGGGPATGMEETGAVKRAERDLGGQWHLLRHTHGGQGQGVCSGLACGGVGAHSRDFGTSSSDGQWRVEGEMQ